MWALLSRTMCSWLVSKSSKLSYLQSRCYSSVYLYFGWTPTSGQSAPTHNARDQNDPRRNRNGGAGDEENGRIPPEVVEMLNRLARLANETNGIVGEISKLFTTVKFQPNNDNLRLDGQDYNVHISVSQHSYLVRSLFRHYVTVLDTNRRNASADTTARSPHSFE